MPEGYSYEIRVTAMEMFVIDGLTYEQVAEQTGVSISQVKRWGIEGKWTEARKEHRDALISIQQNTVKLREKLLNTALESGDPQSVYAFTAMERAAAALRPKDSGEQAQADIPKIFLENLEFIAKTLGEIDPEGLKVMSRNFDRIIKAFKESHAQTA